MMTTTTEESYYTGRLKEEAENLAAKMFASRFFVIHDTARCSQDDESKSKQQ
jgi:hypothetical protein